MTRPGGVLAVQEADVVTLSCQPPNPACDRLIEVLIEVFERIGGDPWAGPKMFNLLRGAGLEDVRYRPFVVGATHADRFAGLPAGDHPLAARRHGVAWADRRE